jgi:hypothetical protein
VLRRDVRVYLDSIVKRVLVMAFAAVALRSGCAATGAVAAGAPASSAPAPATAPTADPYSLSDADSVQCSTEPTYDRLKAAFATDAITAENSRLATPTDPSIVRQGPDAVAQQERAWAALSPADRLFEECKPFFEAGVVPSPTPAP